MISAERIITIGGAVLIKKKMNSLSGNMLDSTLSHFSKWWIKKNPLTKAYISAKTHIGSFVAA